jgi:hypothetical protein
VVRETAVKIAEKNQLLPVPLNSLIISGVGWRCREGKPSSHFDPGVPMLIKCDGCNAKLKAPDRLVGRKVKCPKCAVVFTIAVTQTDALPPPSTPLLSCDNSPPEPASHLADIPKTVSYSEQKSQGDRNGEHTPRLDILSALPHLPESCLAGFLTGFSPRDSINSLVHSAELTSVCDAVARWMLQNPSRGLGTTLPGLWLARDQEIQIGPLPVRIGKALTRLSITVWGDVLELTPSILLDICGFGQGSLEPFLTAAVAVSMEACSHQAPPTRVPTVDSFEVRCFPRRPSFKAAQFACLVDWAVSEMNATVLNDVMTISSQPQLPEDIVLLCDAIRMTPLADLVPGVARKEPLETILVDLWGVLDERDRLIFAGRISLNHQCTLEGLANQVGVTKERVRQLALRAESRIRDALATPRFTPIGWRAHTLLARLGTAVPGNTEHLKDAIEFVTRGMSDTDRVRILDLLFWLAGPYTWDSDTGWLRSGEIPGPEVIDAYADERGNVDLLRLQQHLAKCGMLPAVQPVWCDQIGNLRKIGDCWMKWVGTIADKAARILDVWGKPATPEEIVVGIGEGHDVRGTRARLFEDERFMRVDMTRVALRSWGLEEYSTIAEEIDQEIDRQGGTADINELVSTLIARFNLREQSIRIGTNAPMFFIHDGTIRRRTEADPHDPVPPVTTTAGCYLLRPEVLAWRIEINTDSLRGSGRPMPTSIAAWLGVLPGSRRSLIAEGDMVNVSWPATSGSGPSLGSIRSQLETEEAGVGDEVLVVFGREKGTVAVTRLDPVAVNSTQGIERLSILTGLSLEDGGTLFLHALGQALGTRGTHASIKAALRERGESALAALVPIEEESPDLDEAIAALKGLF